jgi:hypothetical protein
MDAVITLPHLNELMTRHAACVSIYMPAHRTGNDRREDPLRLKNLLHKAEDSLKAEGVRLSDARRLLEPIQSLLNNLDFWQHQSDGLVFFASADIFRYYRLPVIFEERLTVAKRFYLKPLWAFLNTNAQFYVLAFNKDFATLYLASLKGINEMPALPLNDTYEGVIARRRSENSSQFTRNGGNKAMGKRSSVRFGHGGGEENFKDDLRTYLRKVESAVYERIKTSHLPLVVLCEKSLFGYFKEISRYPYLITSAVECNPNFLSLDDIHHKSVTLIEPGVRTVEHKVIELYQRLSAKTPARTSDRLAVIMQKADEGKVEALIAASDVERWGRYDQAGGSIEHDERQPDDEDLSDLAGYLTLLHNGQVHFVPQARLPAGKSVIAILRPGAAAL